MLGVEKVFNNGGLLDVRFSQDLAEVSIIKKLEKTTDSGDKFFFLEHWMNLKIWNYRTR